MFVLIFALALVAGFSLVAGPAPLVAKDVDQIFGSRISPRSISERVDCSSCSQGL